MVKDNGDRRWGRTGVFPNTSISKIKFKLVSNPDYDYWNWTGCFLINFKKYNKVDNFNSEFNANKFNGVYCSEYDTPMNLKKRRSDGRKLKKDEEIEMIFNPLNHCVEFISNAWEYY